jgi:hypothetical protein
VKKYVYQGWLFRTAVFGVVAGLFAVTVFTPEINPGSDGAVGRYLDYYVPCIRSTPAAFSASQDCVYITEPANSAFARMPDSTQNFIPLYAAFLGLDSARLPQGKWTCLSYSISRQSFGQVCLLLDIPPPSV